MIYVNKKPKIIKFTFIFWQLKYLQNSRQIKPLNFMEYPTLCRWIFSSITHLSSPFNPLSIASGRSDLKRSWVIPGEPRHKVDKRLMTVDILGLDLDSGVLAPGVLAKETLWLVSPALCNLCRSSSMSPCWARGTGSMPLRVNLSAKEAKHLRAPSATCYNRIKTL